MSPAGAPKVAAGNGTNSYVACDGVLLVSSPASVDPINCNGTNHIGLHFWLWEPGSAIGVYIDNIPTGWSNGGAIYNAICAGLQSWGPVDGRSYTCHSTTGTPPSTTTAPYVFVTDNTSTAGPKSWTTPFGTSRDNRQPLRAGPDLKAQVVYAVLESGLAAVDYTGQNDFMAAERAFGDHGLESKSRFEPRRTPEESAGAH